MEVFGGLAVWAIIIGLIVYFSKKKKQEKALVEEKLRHEEALEEEKRQKELEKLQEKWEQKKEEFLTNGLPILDEETLNLTKNEVCHFMGDANFCKIKQQITGYEGGSRGVSIRVMKGVSFRVGNHCGHSIKEDVIEKTHGIIYLTSKKLVFSAIKNSCVIKYNDIINLNVIDAMLQIQTEKKAYLFAINDSFNFMVILDFIINKSEQK